MEDYFDTMFRIFLRLYHSYRTVEPTDDENEEDLFYHNGKGTHLKLLILL